MDATASRRGASRSQLNSSKRDSPRYKPRGIQTPLFGICVATDREAPRHEPVASLLRNFCEAVAEGVDD